MPPAESAGHHYAVIRLGRARAVEAICLRIFNCAGGGAVVC